MHVNSFFVPFRLFFLQLLLIYLNLSITLDFWGSIYVHLLVVCHMWSCFSHVCFLEGDGGRSVDISVCLFDDLIISCGNESSLFGNGTSNSLY